MRKKIYLNILKVRDHLGDLDVDKSIILKLILKVVNDDVNWIHLAQDRDQCRVLVNMIMKLRAPWGGGEGFFDQLNDCQLLKDTSL
jgi:hypothetical protein